MKTHFITTLMLLIACTVLSACAEEQAAQKASVDLKPAGPSHAVNGKAPVAGQKPAASKSAATTKEPAAKEPAPSAKSAVKVPAVPTADGAKEPAAPARGAAKVAAAPPADAAKAPAAPAKGAAKSPPAADAAKTAAGPTQPAAKAPVTPPAPAGKAADAPAAAQGAAKTPGAPTQTTAKVEEPPPALSVPPGYRYEPRGRRDPFVSPIPKPRGGAVEESMPLVRPDGLPGVLVSEVKLSGIVHSTDAQMNKAMLVVGRNTYFAKKGDSLFDGVIKEIRPNEVVFTMVSARTRKSINRDTVVRTGASSATSAGEKK